MLVSLCWTLIRARKPFSLVFRRGNARLVAAIADVTPRNNTMKREILRLEFGYPLVRSLGRVGDGEGGGTFAPALLYLHASASTD